VEKPLGYAVTLVCVSVDLFDEPAFSDASFQADVEAVPVGRMDDQDDVLAVENGTGVVDSAVAHDSRIRGQTAHRAG